MIQQAIDLLLGRAFSPDFIDTSVTLARRFAKRPLLAVTIFKDGIEVVPVSFSGGSPVFGKAEFNPTGGEDVDANFLRATAERHKTSECLLNLTTGYTAVLSSRASRPDNDEEAILLMRDNPERILGEPPTQGCRHSLAFHPTHNFAVVFAHRESEINMAVALAAKAELGIARLHCGVSSLLIHILGNHWSEVGREAEFLFVDRGSLFYLPAAEGSLGRPLFDVGLKEAALNQAIAERVGKLKSGGRVILVNSSGVDIEAMIKERAADITVVSPMKDDAQPALLACCSDKPRLAYDLYPNDRVVRPFAPRSLRVVPFTFWAAAAVSVAVIGINMFRQGQASRMAGSYVRQSDMLDQMKKHSDDVIHEAQSRADNASAICNWLLISPMTQSLLVDLTREIQGATEQAQRDGKPVARVESLSLTRQEGQPQMRLVIVVLGEPSAANRIFQRVSALFGRMGYSTVDLKETLVPQGFRYEHLLNIPKPGES
ncbi:MAG: hypothetical protein ABSA05_14985 [Opitutaceae bacterium]|jgi:hypothetical protein